MAGIKGKSGGARANSGGARANSGGARPGAGRKPKEKPETRVIVPVDDRDMLKLLQDVALGFIEASPIQVRAAIAAVQYTHMKKGDGGKRDEQADKSKAASGGKFKAASAPLKLVKNGF